MSDFAIILSSTLMGFSVLVVTAIALKIAFTPRKSRQTTKPHSAATRHTPSTAR